MTSSERIEGYFISTQRILLDNKRSDTLGWVSVRLSVNRWATSRGRMFFAMNDLTTIGRRGRGRQRRFSSSRRGIIRRTRHGSRARRTTFTSRYHRQHTRSLRHDDVIRPRAGDVIVAFPSRRAAFTPYSRPVGAPCWFYYLCHYYRAEGGPSGRRVPVSAARNSTPMRSYSYRVVSATI